MTIHCTNPHCDSCLGGTPCRDALCPVCLGDCAKGCVGCDGTGWAVAWLHKIARAAEKIGYLTAHQCPHATERHDEECDLVADLSQENQAFKERVAELEKNLNIYWQALYSIRCSAEHVGKKSTARRLRAEVEEHQKTADDAIKEVKGDTR